MPTRSPVPTINAKYCCFRLRVGRSRIHHWGLYAEEDIPAHRKVIEYTGEKLDPRQRRQREHTRYLFVLDDYWTLDGSVGGSGAELVNHSCEPNLAARIMRGHILYFSRRQIRNGEELTVDYNYDETDEVMKCACRAENCRGTINRLR